MNMLGSNSPHLESRTLFGWIGRDAQFMLERVQSTLRERNPTDYPKKKKKKGGGGGGGHTD